MAKGKSILKFFKPASFWGALWREGLPTGNGLNGVSVLGGASHDSLIINHNDLWWHGHTGVLPDVSDKNKNIIKNLSNGGYVEAQSVLTDALIAKGYRPKLSYPLPLCSLNVDMPIEKGISDYFRQINMDNGEVTVSFKDKNTKFERCVFVSRVNNTICYEIRKSGSKPINCNLSLALHNKSNNRTPSGAIAEVPDIFDTKNEKGFMCFSCRNENGSDFGVVAKVIVAGGTETFGDFGINIVGADKVTVYIKTFIESIKEREFESLKQELNAIKLTYDKLLKEHSLVFSKLLNTNDINLSGTSPEFCEQMVDNIKFSKIDAQAVETLYNYGKYLFVCSTAEGGTPTNPYGIFNGDYKAADSTRNNFLQTQRLYNFTYQCGLSSLCLPLFKRYCVNIDDYKKNATRLFNCRGIYIPAFEAPESGLLGMIEPQYVMNFNVGAFVAQMFYQYYTHTDDIKFMKDYGIDFIIEVANFYEDFFKLNKTTNVFESPYGFSPYNTAKNCLGKRAEQVCVASNCAIDFACAKQVFSIILDIAPAAKLDNSVVEKYTDLLSKLPDYEVDNDGILKEYNSKIFDTNNMSPYIAYLFPYCVGSAPLVSQNGFAELVKNTCKSRLNNCKGQFSAGNLISMLTAFATVGDGEDYLEVCSLLFQNLLTNNLTFATADWTGMGITRKDAWGTFNIDTNTGFCLTLQNLFINSYKNEINLFKTLPTIFNKGSVSNLILDKQIRADLEFNRKRGLLKLKLKSPRNAIVSLNLPNKARKIKGVEPTQIDYENGRINDINLLGNKTLNLKIRWIN